MILGDVCESAFAALMCAEVERKRTLVAELAEAVAAGRVDVLPGRSRHALPEAVVVPGRPERPVLVEPRELADRKLTSPEGRAALVHAVAHIEFNAINLALDAIYRFRDFPADYYRDWLGIAVDEARHFGWLSARLAELGHRYGDFPAHNGLWAMAVQTADDPLARMALVPRVLEARGLDVTPGMIRRLAGAGDRATVAILERILAEEIGHVAAGTRWFKHCCAARGCEPLPTFLGLLERVPPGALRGPHNVDARRSAGFTEAELAALARP